ncbi:ComEA family DNA-binding protein [Eggerthellaceae bacterium zg-887]|uniref:helix-hairpin-helix domain-containing protein n=1 Tax=Xiamenia xianingshaonis TaxID=2682776 RepID=UPI00140E48CC|nr:ComEA family DNA-binding protein [Xiamenia xianingshaonis]NHM15649.1 ComEA family DNA-binding protein [Xiamenia xianingshaonis]
MAFVEQAESLRSKAHLGGARLPVAIGIAVAAVAVVVFAGASLFGAVSGESLVIEQALAGQEAGAGQQPEKPSEDASKAQEQASEKSSGQEGETAAAGASGAAGELGAEPVAAVPATVFVHVGGAVASPGVYEMSASSRVADAIELAGGFSADGAPDAVNLARPVVDGERIIVPTQEEYAAAGTGWDAAAQEAPGTAGSSTGAAEAAPALVNINTATAEELQTLSGVGPSTAEKIVADRDANGPFETCEDLQRVSGIGEKKYAALADFICVG